MYKKLIEKIKNEDLKVCVVGLGYVGFPLLELINSKGFRVVGLDSDVKKVLNAKKNKLEATKDYCEALTKTDCVIVCVPTPVDDNHRPDLSLVKSAFEGIVPYICKDMLIVLESTVAPGTTKEIIIPILDRSGLVAGKDFFIAHCPERIDPGNKKWNVENIPRIVGGINHLSTDLAYFFYTKILDSKVMRMSSINAAEAVKIVENSFRDINIAFVNELAKSFDKIGLDTVEIIQAASTKPFGFMPHYPGCGVGGHCIAVDPYYLIEKAAKSGFTHHFLKLARKINDSMPNYTVDKIMHSFNKIGKCINGSKITLLGLSYKGGIGDVRESPAFPILDMLKELHADITIFDPYVMELSSVKSLKEALTDSLCAVIITDHPEFKIIDPLLLKRKGIKIVIDGRNILDKDSIQKLGIVYEGIGR